MTRILPIVALILTFGLALGYVEPTYANTITTLKAKIDGDNKALEAATNYQAKESVLVKEKEEISLENLKHLETFLPSGVNNIPTIIDLNALASRSNVVITNVNVTTPSASAESGSQTPVGSVEISLSANASYAAFRNFLAGIEKSARILDVTSLSVSGTDTGVYSYGMSLRLYWLR